MSNVKATINCARQALASGDEARALASLDALAPHVDDIGPVETVDLLERAAALSTPAAIERVWQLFDGDFAYTGWALALALRTAGEKNARYLLKLGVDLLGEVRTPRRRALLPHEGTFTRFDLTRESPTLFLNNMDPTVSTEVFEPFKGNERIAGPGYAPATDIAATCACVLSIVRDGLFDTVVFNDLFRAAMVKAWHLLRSERPQDLADAESCLELGRQMLALHRERGMGDATIELVLGNLMVPKAARRIIEFVCINAPQVFLNRLVALSWLQADIDLVRSMVPTLTAGTETQNGLLLRLLAQEGLLPQMELLTTWPRTFTRQNVIAALEAASAAGHAEAATWLLAHLETPTPTEPAKSTPTKTTQDAGEKNEVSQPKPTTNPDTNLGRDEDTSNGDGPKKAVKVGLPPEVVPASPSGDASPVGAPSGASADASGETEPDERLTLALKVLDLTRQSIIADNPFLAASLSLLEPQPVSGMRGTFFSTNGRVLAFDPAALLEAFRTSRQLPVRELTHVLVHCVLLHPFVGAKIRRDAWDLATDLVAEGLVDELCGAQDSERGRKLKVIHEQIAADLSATCTAERLYHALRDGSYQNTMASWADAAYVDDHAAWYPTAEADQLQSRASDSAAGDGANGSGSAGQAGQPNQAETQQDGAQGDEETGAATPEEGIGRPDHPADADAEGAAGTDAAGTPSPQDTDALSPLSDAERASALEAWRQTAKSMHVELETLSRNRGAKLSGLMRELEVSTHERVDYREFLRQFAIRNEEPRLSDDEFDYVFYTYGLTLYKDMPLIEPLEYKSEKRIRDFVIVIDTSSSVTDEVVQQFINTTFDVLTSESSFFGKTNIHIIQADARVQSDTKITSIAELDRWRRNIKLYGFGGTDFRPAFRYVNELLANGEFQDLSGLIYFTDGWGIYPRRMPPYKTTFVFYDEDHRPELVPAWAMQITLHPGEFQSMSVY